MLLIFWLLPPLYPSYCHGLLFYLPCRSDKSRSACQQRGRRQLASAIRSAAPLRGGHGRDRISFRNLHDSTFRFISLRNFLSSGGGASGADPCKLIVSFWSFFLTFFWISKNAFFSQNGSPLGPRGAPKNEKNPEKCLPGGHFLPLPQNLSKNEDFWTLLTPAN